MLLKTRCFTKKSTRRGSLTLELVLILPIIFLLVALIYQVSVMMMTHQALQSAAMLAVKTAKLNDATDVKVQAAVETALKGWYFEKEYNAPLAANRHGTIDLFYKANASDSWTGPVDINNVSTIPRGYYIGVQLKVTEMGKTYPQYWLLNQFMGVKKSHDGSSGSAAMIATACGIKQ